MKKCKTLNQAKSYLKENHNHGEEIYHYKTGSYKYVVCNHVQWLNL
jgi:hypothetical protein